MPEASTRPRAPFEAISPAKQIIDTLPSASFEAVCLHEATHAVVALALGLTVEEVNVTGAMRSDEATERMYGLSGTELPVLGVRIPDEFLETHPRELFAVMAAPSFLSTGIESLDRYASEEADTAADAARERGVDPAEVADLAAATVAAEEARIRDFAGILAREGVWTEADYRQDSGGR